MKTCFKCNVLKSLDEFYVKDRHTDRLDGMCKACRLIFNREHKYGITDAEFWTLYNKQDGKCGICKRRMYSKRYKVFCVDHVHATGEIRGLLCHNCNRALGMFRDCPTALRRAARWVEGIVRSSQ